MPPLRSRTVAAVVAVAVGAFLLIGRGSNEPADPVGLFDPATVSSPTWDTVLGGDSWPPAPEALARLEADHGTLDRSVAAAASQTVRDLALAETTGADAGPFAEYLSVTVEGVVWPVRCATATVDAVGVIDLPVADEPGRWVKAVSVVSNPCDPDGDSDPDEGPPVVAGPQVRYHYLRLGGDGWVPKHPWEIPGAVAGAGVVGVAVPASWDLTALEDCDPSGALTGAGAVPDAWRRMCADAAADGVQLTALSAHRSVSDQAQLFDAAVAHYGNLAEARRWVAYADESLCASEHCAGTAVDVDVSAMEVRRWLFTIVACVAPEGAITILDAPVPAEPGDEGDRPGICGDGTPVRRVARYGFAATVPSNVGHLNYQLDVGLAGDLPDELG